MSTYAPLIPPLRNLITNPEFSVAQRGAGPFTSTSVPVNNDDTYLIDGWVFLAEGADACDVSSSTSGLPTGSLAGARAKCILDIETANLKFGVIHFLENKDALEIIGGTASLSLKARYVGGTSVSTCRADILAWSSTADVVTSDVVSTWDATDAGVTLVANWTSEGSVTFTPTTSWAEFKLENVSIDTASATNVAVFIWADDTTATTAGEFLELTDVNLVRGAIATPIVRRSFALELKSAQRTFRRFGGVTNAPITNGGWITGASQALIPLIFPTMRTTVAATFSATAGDYTVSNVTSAACSSISAANPSSESFVIVAGTAAVMVAGQGAYLIATNTTGVINVSAEL